MTADHDDTSLLAPLEFVLGQGNREQLDATRRALAGDPLGTLETAELRDFVERWRALRVEPSGFYAAKLADVMVRAERSATFRRGPQRRPLGRWLLAAAAGLTAFAGLRALDPLARWQRPARQPDLVVAEAAPTPAEDGAPTVDAKSLAWQSYLATLQQRFGGESPQLRSALDRATQTAADPLAAWVDPRNAMVMMRLDHQLRQSPAVRERALEQRGSLRVVDGRVQQLGDEIARELLDRLTDRTATMPAISYAVRAVLAAGATTPRRLEALTRAGDWCAERLPAATGRSLAELLVPLAEVAAVLGRHVDLVAQHGGRLVDEVLTDDGDLWSRWRPELVSTQMPLAQVAEAARLCVLLPAFEVPADRCRLLRQLLLGNLRERRDHGADGPDVLAAMLYGGGDLLPEAERTDYERQLRRWKPARLAPDYVTVQQLAWAIPPGRVGASRWAQELRGLAALATPSDLGDRGAFCLGLATPYAAWPLATSQDPLGE